MAAFDRICKEAANLGFGVPFLLIVLPSRGFFSDPVRDLPSFYRV